MTLSRHTRQIVLTLMTVIASGCSSSRPFAPRPAWLTAHPEAAVNSPVGQEPTVGLHASFNRTQRQLLEQERPSNSVNSPFQLVAYNASNAEDEGSEPSPSDNSTGRANDNSQNQTNQDSSPKVDATISHDTSDQSNLIVPAVPDKSLGVVGELGQAPLTLGDIESIAQSNNPTLRELAFTTQKAAAYRNQVGLRPNPVVGYQAMQLADRSTDQHTAFVEQEIIRGNKLDLNSCVLNEALRAQLFELETQRVRISTDIRTKFYEVLTAQRQIELVQEFQLLAAKGLELAELRKKAAEGSQIDVLQAKVQKNEIELAYQQAQVAFAAAWREMAALAGASYLTPTRLIGELPSQAEQLDWNAVAASTIQTSPELKVAQARVSQARALLQRQLAQPISNLTVQMAAGVDNGTNSGMLNLQVGAPVPVFNQNQGNIAAARAEVCRSVAELQRIENSISARLAAVSQQYDAALAAVTSYSMQILPSAEQSLELAELAYEAGETNFIQVLVARKTYFDSNLQLALAQGQLAQAHALVDGFVLSGGLDAINDQSGDSSLRDLSFSQQ